MSVSGEMQLIGAGDGGFGLSAASFQMSRYVRLWVAA
jgi:hypothetical protein